MVGVLVLTVEASSAASTGRAAGLGIGLPFTLPTWPPLPFPHLAPSPANPGQQGQQGQQQQGQQQQGHVVPGNFTEEELVDSKKTARLEGGTCQTEQCQSHCRQRLHASGRCDQDLCVCRDLKARGRCQQYGYGCGSDAEEGGAGRNIVNNNNNNNVLVIH
ncbi:uncharacterized protein LOC117647476 isoform X2 [Thrips palmi]|nr:uncharacterized protein LOC117647476 isoform X2 [Thrips palmi]